MEEWDDMHMQTKPLSVETEDKELLPHSRSDNNFCGSHQGKEMAENSLSLVGTVTTKQTNNSGRKS